MVLDFTERISRSDNFTANFRLLYSHTDANNGLLLICQPVVLENECERSFMQLKDGFEVVSTPDESFKGRHRLKSENHLIPSKGHIYI